MLGTNIGLPLVLLILRISGTLSQLGGLIGTGEVVSITNEGRGPQSSNVPPPPPPVPPKVESKVVPENSSVTTLNTDSMTRALGQQYKEKPDSNKVVLGLKDQYRAKAPVSVDDDDEDTDDIIDKQSLRSNKVVKVRPVVQDERTLRKGSRKGTQNDGGGRAVNPEDSSEEEDTPQPVRKKKKRIKLESAESILKFVEETSEPQSTNNNGARGKSSKGRTLDGNPTASNSQNDTTTDFEGFEEKTTGKKNSKAKQRKMRNWFKKMMFDPEFMKNLDSGSSENSKVIWLGNKQGNGTPSVLIIPQKIYDINYKVYREGNHQENTYNTNITPNSSSEGDSFKFIQSPRQITKAGSNKDTMEESDLDLDSQSQSKEILKTKPKNKRKKKAKNGIKSSKIISETLDKSDGVIQTPVEGQSRSFKRTKFPDSLTSVPLDTVESTFKKPKKVIRRKDKKKKKVIRRKDKNKKNIITNLELVTSTPSYDLPVTLKATRKRKNRRKKLKYKLTTEMPSYETEISTISETMTSSSPEITTKRHKHKHKKNRSTTMKPLTSTFKTILTTTKRHKHKHKKRKHNSTTEKSNARNEVSTTSKTIAQVTSSGPENLSDLVARKNAKKDQPENLSDIVAKKRKNAASLNLTEMTQRPDSEEKVKTNRRSKGCKIVNIFELSQAKELCNLISEIDLPAVPVAGRIVDPER